MTLGDKIKSFDFFGQRIGFKIAGRGSLNSYLGALLSILITILTLFYAISRFSTLKNYGDSTHQYVKETNVFTDEIFEQSQTNFNIAFGIQNMNAMFGNYQVDYSNYLEIQANLVKVTHESLGDIIALSLRPCRLDDYETKFNQADAAQIQIKPWFEKGDLLCFEEPENDLNLRGQIG